MRVLIVEDYAPVRNAVAKALRDEGYAVDETDNGDDGLECLHGREYDVVVLDLILPGREGLEILAEIRKSGSNCGVLIVSARDTIADRIRGLDLGADDYLVKPFSIEELVARVRALVRRGYPRRAPTIRVGHVTVDTNNHTVTSDGEEVELTAKEYALFEYLARRLDEVVTRADILEHIYDERTSASSNVVDVYINALRKKLERPERQKLLHTRRGEGYFLSGGNGRSPSKED